MERRGRQTASDKTGADSTTVDPALRDALAIAARAADAAAAADARVRYSDQQMPTLEPDARVAELLAPAERVLAARPDVVFERRHSIRGSVLPQGLAADLYVTSRRVVVVGCVTLSIGLCEIEEVGVSGERILLILRDGSSLWVQTRSPRLLRVEIGTARASAGPKEDAAR